MPPGAVYGLALFLTGDPTRAEDLIADAFVRAWTARDRIRYQTVRAYLLTITRNLYRDQLRARRTFVELDERVAGPQPGADARPGLSHPGVIIAMVWGVVAAGWCHFDLVGCRPTLTWRNGSVDRLH